MIKAVCSKYDNVIVVPSGEYIISNNTFPAYFEKDNLQEAKIDVSSDVYYFGEAIVPIFNIKYRFVGEEPNDKVTAQYNIALKERLPHYGCNVIELKRKTYGDKVISASHVRQLLKTRNFEEIKDFVQDEVYQYLKEN